MSGVFFVRKFLIISFNIGFNLSITARLLLKYWMFLSLIGSDNLALCILNSISYLCIQDSYIFLMAGLVCCNVSLHLWQNSLSQSLFSY